MHWGGSSQGTWYWSILEYRYFFGAIKGGLIQALANNFMFVSVRIFFRGLFWCPEAGLQFGHVLNKATGSLSRSNEQYRQFFWRSPEELFPISGTDIVVAVTMSNYVFLSSSAGFQKMARIKKWPHLICFSSDYFWFAVLAEIAKVDDSRPKHLRDVLLTKRGMWYSTENPHFRIRNIFVSLNETNKRFIHFVFFP